MAGGPWRKDGKVGLARQRVVWNGAFARLSHARLATLLVFRIKSQEPGRVWEAGGDLRLTAATPIVSWQRSARLRLQPFAPAIGKDGLMASQSLERRNFSGTAHLVLT